MKLPNNMTNFTERKKWIVEKLAQFGFELNQAEITIREQKGGLFNQVYFVDAGYQSWFVKIYLDKNVSKVFQPPQISRQRRAKLAFEVQKLAFELCNRGSLFTNILPAKVCFDEADSILFVKGLTPGNDLIEFIAEGLPPSGYLSGVLQSLGYLHSYTFNLERYISSSMYKNTVFRDYKLGLQYTNIAKELNSAQREVIHRLVEDYKTQTYCVLHGDINSRNIIIPKHKNQTGVIIDFEQSHIGNPVYDIAYILCEFLISGLNHVDNSVIIDKQIQSAMLRYLEVFDIFLIANFQRDLILHLLIQGRYRFLGPSKNSWTFYVKETRKTKILELLCDILIAPTEKITELFDYLIAGKLIQYLIRVC
ncbi:MAG: aminoglycoside phosphotransferase family protein [Microcoleaceae cyanobacterium]